MDLGKSQFSNQSSNFLNKFTKEKNPKNKEDENSIVFVPKTKEQINEEQKQKIGTRVREPWEVDKVICIRFEVWSERKKLIKKGQIVDYKKENVSHFDKIFKQDLTENYFDQFETPSKS
jgi:hypothetical protein